MNLGCVLRNHLPFNRRWIDLALSAPGLFVFLFHPVHILMNSSEMLPYQQWMRSDKPRLTPVPTNGNGVRRGAGGYYMELVQAMAANGVESVRLSECIPAEVAF
jgi:hypothetical protein